MRHTRRRGPRACRKVAVLIMRAVAHVRCSGRAERDLNEFATPNSLRLSAVEPKCGARRAYVPHPRALTWPLRAAYSQTRSSKERHGPRVGTQRPSDLLDAASRLFDSRS